MSEREECGHCHRTESEGHAFTCPDYSGRRMSAVIQSSAQPVSDPLVLVRWIDSMAYDRWEQRSVIRSRLVEEAGGLEHVTVGWLIDEDERHIIVAASRHSTEDVWNGAMAIPRVAVLSQVTLVMPDADR